MTVLFQRVIFTDNDILIMGDDNEKNLLFCSWGWNGQGGTNSKEALDSFSGAVGGTGGQQCSMDHSYPD